MLAVRAGCSPVQPDAQGRPRPGRPRAEDRGRQRTREGGRSRADYGVSARHRAAREHRDPRPQPGSLSPRLAQHAADGPALLQQGTRQVRQPGAEARSRAHPVVQREHQRRRQRGPGRVRPGPTRAAGRSRKGLRARQRPLLRTQRALGGRRQRALPHRVSRPAPRGQQGPARGQLLGRGQRGLPEAPGHGAGRHRSLGGGQRRSASPTPTEPISGCGSRAARCWRATGSSPTRT